MKLLFCFVQIIFVSMTAVYCLLRLPSEAEVNFQDDVYIRLNEGARTRRAANDKKPHPETYDFNLSVGNKPLKVHLKRNDKLTSNVRTFALKGGSVNEEIIADNEDSVFYQDVNTGAVFVVQEDNTGAKSLFGVFGVDGENYIIQTPGRNKTIEFGNNYNKFQMFKEQKLNVTFDHSFRNRLMPENKHHGANARRKRAAGSYQVELLIVTDYSIYKYWYDKSTKATASEKATDAILTIRQFYAFVISGMDAMYKNIQTTDYTISILFTGIIIAQTPSDSPWTETIAVTSVTPNQVDAASGLSNFHSWITSTSNLPGHDHAMLFTRYEMTYGGSIYYTGFAYVGTACKSYAQSFVEDHFNFILLTVASHELGHSLSANHDGSGNTCNDSYAYIMASSSDPVTGSIATNPWKFSTCSTTYFTTYLNSLDSAGSNCMRSLSTTYNASALAEFANVKPGQEYDANAQCANIEGTGSYLCTSFYSGGDLSTICTLMWCYMPSKPGYCSRNAVAADGTGCGTNKWCIAGVCTAIVTTSTTSAVPTTPTTSTKPTTKTTTTTPTTTTKPTTTTTPITTSTPTTTIKPTTTTTTPTTTTKPSTTISTPTTTKPTTTTTTPITTPKITTTTKPKTTTKKRRRG